MTMMLAAISADSRHARESLSTLRYAARAKTITNTKVRTTYGLPHTTYYPPLQLDDHSLTLTPTPNQARNKTGAEDKAKIRELHAELARLREIAEAGGKGGELAELRAAAERGEAGARAAAAAARTAAARGDDLQLELEAARVNLADLEATLARESAALRAAEATSRQAEIEARQLEREIAREATSRSDLAHNLAAAEEERGALRRQLAQVWGGACMCMCACAAYIRCA